MRRNNFDLLALALWCGMIFTFSGIPGLSSGLEQDFILRKVAHSFEYAVLAALFYNVLRVRRHGKASNILLSALFALFYAFTDEAHQTFVAGRSGNIFDIGVDSLGIIMGIVFIFVMGLIRGKR